MRASNVLLSAAIILILVGVVGGFYYSVRSGSSTVASSTSYLRSLPPAQQGQENFLCLNGALQSTLPDAGYVSSSSSGVNGDPGVTLQYCGSDGFGGPTMTVSSINLTLYYKEIPRGLDHFSAYLTGVPCQPRDYDPYYPPTGTSCYIGKFDVPVNRLTPISNACVRMTFSWAPASGLTLTKGEPLSLVLFFPHETTDSAGPYDQHVQVCSGSSAAAGVPAQYTPSALIIKGTPAQ